MNSVQKPFFYIILLTTFIAGTEFYIGTYIWSDFYFYSARYYLVVGIFLSFSLIFLGSGERLERLYLIIVVLVFISGVLNGSSISGLLYYFKQYVLPLVFALWVIRFPSERYLNSLLLMININIALNIAWFLGVNPLPNSYADNWADFAIGTLGSSNVAFFSLLFLIYFYYNKQYLKSFIYAMGLVMSNSFALWAISIGVFVSFLRIKVSSILYIIILLPIAIYGFKILMPDIYFNTTKRVDIVSGLNFAKLDLYLDMIDDFVESPEKLLLGFGPGLRSSHASELTDSRFYNYSIKMINHRNNIISGSVMDKYHSAIVSILWEIGILGLVLQFFFIYYILKDKSKAFTLSVVLVIFAVSMIYDNFRYNNISILTYIFLGTLLDSRSKGREDL